MCGLNASPRGMKGTEPFLTTKVRSAAQPDLSCGVGLKRFIYAALNMSFDPCHLTRVCEEEPAALRQP
jgi:hypothetical protein